MGDVGEDFKGLSEAIARQRDLSKQKAVQQLPEAQAAATAAGLTLVVGNEGHHWRFMKGGSLLLNFWPASAKAQRLAGQPFRCRGWKHALSLATKIGQMVTRGDSGWTT